MENQDLELFTQELDVEQSLEQNQEELIGYGISAEVFLVSESKEKKYVLKKFNSEYSPEDIKQEGELQQKLNESENILKLYQINKKQLVLEYAPKGDLFQYVRRVRFSENLARHFFVQLITGMVAMHRENIAHLDIKLDNLLLDEDYNLKIADFGWASQYKGNQLLSQRAGTEGMFPPEMIEYKPYAPEKVDCFLCGVVLYTMVCGMSPITSKAKKTDKIYKYFANNMSHMLWKALKQKKGIQVSEDFKNLIEQMINYNYKQRPSFSEILEHNWIKKGETYSNKQELVKEMDAIKDKFNNDNNSSLKHEQIESESKENI